MWWNSSRTASACSAVMAVILATSRLTFCTSSSLSCCSSCALEASPRATSNMAALRRVGSASASLVVFRIMVGTPAQASVLLLPDPVAQDLHRNVRFLGDLLPQVFGKDFGLLGDDGREFERTQRLGIHLSLQRIALGKLGFHLVLNLVRRQQCRRGTVRAGRLQGRRTAHGGADLLDPPFAAEEEGHNAQHQQTRQYAATDEQRPII